jgi:pre-mRNA-processing factor SLU7
MGELDPEKLPNEGDLTGATLPEYVRNQPWYFRTPGDSAGHQRIAPYAQQVRTELSEFYHHGKSKKPEVVKWKPGCCNNCGSSGHSEYDCPERPRKRNARMAGKGVVVKEIPETHKLSFDAKHDRFAGYDTNRWWFQVRGQFRYADQIRAKTDSSCESTAPNIQAEYGHSGFRDRQDLAPYLQNLGSEKIPIPKDDEMWVKSSGEPYQSTKSFENERTLAKEQRSREFYESKQLLAKTLDSRDDLIEIEEFVPKSRYGDAEDRFVNGHSSVFGSYFENGRWGYACCHQLTEDCFCTQTGS